MDLQRRALISLFFFFFLSRTKVCRVKTAAGESDAKDFKVSNLVIGLKKKKHGVGVQSWKATPDSCDLTESRSCRQHGDLLSFTSIFMSCVHLFICNECLAQSMCSLEAWIFLRGSYVTNSQRDCPESLPKNADLQMASLFARCVYVTPEVTSQKKLNSFGYNT